jgi:outer membrane assembly lipoprotein YfiO
MFSRLILLVFSISLLFACTSKVVILKGTDKELYDTIIAEINKERKYLILGGTDYGKLEHLMTTLQVRYPYSEYTREAYVLHGDIAYKQKRYQLAIQQYSEFIKSQTNHPRINYSRFMIFLSYSKLIRNKDLDLGPSLKVVELYNSAPQSYLDDQYMEQTDKIYQMARKFILKRAIYISKFYIEKGEFGSACSRINNASTIIPDLVENSYEAQYLKVVCLAKDKSNNVAIEDLRSSYKSKFPNSPFLDDLDEI